MLSLHGNLINIHEFCDRKSGTVEYNVKIKPNMLFLDLHLSISNGFVSSKIYDKRDDFDFDIVNFPFLDGDVPRSTSYGVYISQLIRFARVSGHVADFNACNKSLTAKLFPTGLSVS